MSHPVWDSSFVLDAIPCAEGQKNQLKLVYNSTENGYTFLEQHGLLSPTVTTLIYGRAGGTVGMYRSSPWRTAEERNSASSDR